MQTEQNAFFLSLLYASHSDATNQSALKYLPLLSLPVLLSQVKSTPFTTCFIIGGEIILSLDPGSVKHDVSSSLDAILSIVLSDDGDKAGWSASRSSLLLLVWCKQLMLFLPVLALLLFSQGLL